MDRDVTQRVGPGANALRFAIAAVGLFRAIGGETNDLPLVPRELFVLSALPPAPPITSATNLPSGSPSPAVVTVAGDAPTNSAISFQTEFESDFASAPPYLQKRVMWVTEGWGRPAKVFEQGGFYGQVLKIFPSPAFIEHHGVIVSGGIVTAIKRKNPLGLINPIILDISF